MKPVCRCGHPGTDHVGGPVGCLLEECGCLGFDKQTKKQRLQLQLNQAESELAAAQRAQSRGRLVIMWAKNGDDTLSVVADMRASDIVIDQNNDYVDVSCDTAREYILAERKITITVRG